MMPLLNDMPDSLLEHKDRPGSLKILKTLRDMEPQRDLEGLIRMCYVTAWSRDDERRQELGYHLCFRWVDDAHDCNRTLDLVFCDTPITYGAAKKHVEAYTVELIGDLSNRKNYCVSYDLLEHMVQWLKDEFVRRVGS